MLSSSSRENRKTKCTHRVRLSDEIGINNIEQIGLYVDAAEKRYYAIKRKEEVSDVNGDTEDCITTTPLRIMIKSRMLRFRYTDTPS